MKKNTKIIVWSIVGLAVATGAFFGIRSLVKKAKARKAIRDTPQPEPDVENKKDDVPPIGETTTLTQAQADTIAYTIRNVMTKYQGNPAAMNKVKTLTSDLLKGGYTYSEGKAVKNAG